MPLAKQLTQHLKQKFTPTILIRDYLNEDVPICFYCEAGFVFGHKYLRQVWDHLNNDDGDSRVENLVWAHWICNEQKKNNMDWRILADEKLQQNIKWVMLELTRKREGENNSYIDTEELTDTEVGKIIDKTTLKFLDERLKGPEPKYCLLRSDTRNCIVFLVKKETNGRGSSQAVDRAIDAYCCSIADYISKKEDGKRIIRLRKHGEKIL